MDAQSFRIISPIGPWRARLVVLAVGALVLLPGLGGRRVLTYHEVCFAQPAREMLASGRWLVPEIAGVVFPDKPPLAHWAAASGMALFGENEFAVRLPFALAGILLACLVVEMGIAARGATVGLVAGLIQLTCYYSLLEARLAECDILLALAVAGGLIAFALVEVFGRSLTWRHAFALHGCTGAAFLAKGPIGLVFICGPLAAYLVLVERRWKNCIRWLHPLGLLVSLAAVVGWPLAAVASHPEILDGWKRHNLDRFSGSLGGDATWPVYYLGMIPLLLLPWTPWIVRGWWEERCDDRPDAVRLRRFALCWILPGLLVISAASWRHKHYAIPLLPPLSLWGAVGLLAWMRSLSPAREGHVHPDDPNAIRRRRLGWVGPFWRRVPMPLLWGAGPAAVGLAVVSLVGKNADVLWPLALLIPTGAASVAWLRRKQQPQWALAALFATVAGAESWTLQQVVPRFDSYAVQSVFARRIAEQIGDEPLYVPHIPTGPGVPLALPENQIAFYLPLKLRILSDSKSSSPPEWVLAPARFHDGLPGFTAVDQCDRLRGSMKSSDRLTLFRRVSHAADHDGGLLR